MHLRLCALIPEMAAHQAQSCAAVAPFALDGQSVRPVTSQSTSGGTALDGNGSEEELRAYAKRSAIKGVAGIVVVFIVIGLAGVFFRDSLLMATSWVHETIGVAGLFLVILLADSVTAPLPPDVVLVVVANTSLSESWYVIVPALGALSVAAGSLGWLLGLWLGDTRIPRILFGRFRKRNQTLVTRYGAWGVALGALTPIPFSVTCWTAGMFKMPYRSFFAVALLRLPRYLLYYAAIAFSDDLMGFFL